MSSAAPERPGDHSESNNNKDVKVRKDISNESKRADSSVRERVLKKVGFTSTAFIGPAGPPHIGKTDIEDKLSEFYKELEDIDSVADGNQEKKDAALPHASISAKSSDRQDANSGQTHHFGLSSDGNTDQGNRHQKPPSWQHWYQNEPYRNPRTSSMDMTSGMNIPTNPSFHRHPFPQYPPPSAPFNPQFQIPNKSHPWSRSAVTNLYQQGSHFPPASHFSRPNGCRPPSRGSYGGPPHHPNRNDWACGSDIQIKHSPVSGSANAKQEWSNFGEDRDWRQRPDREYEMCQQQDRNQHPGNVHRCQRSLVLILMRGLPGSGKSTRAKELLSTGPSGLILSADNYFAEKNGYRYDPCLIGAAHEWNQTKAIEAMNEGRSPVIIDNTNIQAWEMKPYVKMALDRGYDIIFCEPDTRWKFDPLELEKRNKHGVPQEKIAQMMSRFSSPMSIDIVLSSQEPPHVGLRRKPE